MNSQAERMAINTKIQGTAADIVKIAMKEIDKQLSDDVRMLVQVHDELLFEIKEDKVNLSEKIKKIMEQVVDLPIPLVVDIKIGKNWGELMLK